MTRSFVALLTAVTAALAAPPPARAQAPAASAADPTATPASARVLALHVEGTDVEMIAADLQAVLPKGARVETESFDEALGKEGQRGPLGSVIALPKQRARQVAKLRKAATRIRADAILVARGRHERGVVKVRLLWLRPAGGEPSVDDDVLLAGDELARRRALGDKLAPALVELAPAVEKPKVEDAPPPPPPPPPKPTRVMNEVGTALLVTSIGFEVSGRWFHWSDGVSRNLRDYTLMPALSPALGLEVYPFASTGVPIVSDVGLTFAYAHRFAVKSPTPELGALGTSWDHLQASVRYRLRVDDLPFRDRPGDVVNSTIFGFVGGIGLERFSFDATSALAKEVPSVSYAYLHAGLDARFPVQPVSVLIHGRWMGALSAGDVYDRVRGPSLGGIDVGGGLAIRLTAGFELRLVADYMRWFYTFTPKYLDPYVAGGAVDEMLTFHIGAAHAY